MNKAPRAFSRVAAIAAFAGVTCALISAGAAAQNRQPIDTKKARIIDHWTGERRAQAIPRDLVIDPRGLGYLRRADGTLVPHGHDIQAEMTPRRQTPSPFAKPSGGSGDSQPPIIKAMNPNGDTIGASHTFKATVTDNSGVKSVTFKIQKDGSTFVNSFSATERASDVWSAALSGFSGGNWEWWVVAKDSARKGGNTATSDPVTFTVDTGSSSGSGNGDTITNAEWADDGDVQTAAGRLYFEMPTNRKRTRWQGYVCSGTVADDGTNDRSVIITAAHCVYDDVNKAFARNIMFIPNQAETTGSSTDGNCKNDLLGCWVPSFGVVDVDWTTRKFPNNIEWDYAFYVVADSGAHQPGTQVLQTQALETEAGSLPVEFGTPSSNDGNAGAGTADFTHALGYSYSDDPNFMYCAEDMTTEGTVNWWLPSCGLSGGSSGGPWVQPMSSGSGPIISVNSWGYTTSPGMAGPILDSSTSAEQVFSCAKSQSFPSNPPDGEAGVTYVSGVCN